MSTTARKITKVEARYRPYPKATKRCGNCSMFRPPVDCTLVMGEVKSHGYCEKHEAKK